MKIIAITLLSLISSFTIHAQQQGITTIDFVKILEGRNAEAQYFYTQNWAAFRMQALTSEWIADYQLLEVDHKDWDLILITRYVDSIQFKKIEVRFTNWREQNPLKLLNEFTPNDFRKNIEAITSNNKTANMSESWKASYRCSSEEHRAFHFWIGTWNVTTPNGKFAGRNTIKPIQGGCVLHENWISADGEYRGTSYNFYNTKTGKWNQSWIDNQGGVLQMCGGIENGRMVMNTEAVLNKKGEMQIDRIIWIPNSNGTVEQIWEKSVDNRNTWSLVFHGIYKKEE